MNTWAVVLWLVLAGALLRVGWELVGRAFDLVTDLVTERRRKRRLGLVPKEPTDH